MLRLPPSLAAWVTQKLGIRAYSVAFLGLRDANDVTIFEAACAASAIVMSKDADFFEIVINSDAARPTSTTYLLDLREYEQGGPKTASFTEA